MKENNRRLASLKAQKTKLLNKEVNSNEEFEEIQEKLNIIEILIKQEIKED